MPKLIDHAQRQTEFAEATWRVILRDGISAVSLRTVAAEAGHSTGSLRHILRTKEDLLVAATQVMEARATARVRARLNEPEPRTLAAAVIAELLPLDAERRAETEVYNALIAEAPTSERLRTIRDETHADIRAIAREIIEHLRDNGLTEPAIDLAMASAMLHALIDGVAMDLIVNPGTGKQAMELINTFLDSL